MTMVGGGGGNNRFSEFVLASIEAIRSQLVTITAILGSGGGASLLNDGTTGSIPSGSFNIVTTYTNNSGSDQRIKLVVATGPIKAEYRVRVGTDNVIPDFTTVHQGLTMYAPMDVKLLKGATITLEVKHYQTGTFSFAGSIVGV